MSPISLEWRKLALKTTYRGYHLVTVAGKMLLSILSQFRRSLTPLVNFTGEWAQNRISMCNNLIRKLKRKQLQTVGIKKGNQLILIQFQTTTKRWEDHLDLNHWPIFKQRRLLKRDLQALKKIPLKLSPMVSTLCQKGQVQIKSKPLRTITSNHLQLLSRYKWRLQW
jgi:hypothetical protein